jgi:hypothetical protein
MVPGLISRNITHHAVHKNAFLEAYNITQYHAVFRRAVCMYMEIRCFWVNRRFPCVA